MWLNSITKRIPGSFTVRSLYLLSTHAIGKVWIYHLLFVCLFCFCNFVCVFVRLQILSPRIKLAASNFARQFIGVLGRESHISGNFAPPEAQNRMNRAAHEGRWMFHLVTPRRAYHVRVACVDIRQSPKTDVLVCMCFVFRLYAMRWFCHSYIRTIAVTYFKLYVVVVTAGGLCWLQLREFCGFAWRQLQWQSSDDRKTCHSCLTRLVHDVRHTSAAVCHSNDWCSSESAHRGYNTTCYIGCQCRRLHHCFSGRPGPFTGSRTVMRPYTFNCWFRRYR